MSFDDTINFDRSLPKLSEIKIEYTEFKGIDYSSK